MIKIFDETEIGERFEHEGEIFLKVDELRCIVVSDAIDWGLDDIKIQQGVKQWIKRQK